MDPEERKALRKKLLKELYERHFQKGPAFRVDEKKVELETIKAYEYLKEKGLIEFSHFGGSYWNAKIKAYGIDVIESNNELNKL